MGVLGAQILMSFLITGVQITFSEIVREIGGEETLSLEGALTKSSAGA